jgi:hypothetical protein
MTVVAVKSPNASKDDARKAAAGPHARSVNRIEIGGREFWMSETREKESGQEMRTIDFATAINDFVLQFYIVSFDANLMKALENSIEATTFFDPAKAGDVAGDDSRPYNPIADRRGSATAIPYSKRIVALNPGVVSGHIYTNDALGFKYQFPGGWIVNDKATQEKATELGHLFIWGDSPSAAREHQAAQQCTRVLLYVTKYPEGSERDEVLPLILLMAADPQCSPGTRFPATLDDRDAIKQAALQFAGSLAGTPLATDGPTSVNAFMVQGHLTIEIQGSFAISPPSHKQPLNVLTAVDLMEVKDYWVASCFVSGNQNGLQELKNSTKIAFALAPPVVPAVQ